MIQNIHTKGQKEKIIINNEKKKIEMKNYTIQLAMAKMHSFFLKRQKH